MTTPLPLLPEQTYPDDRRAAMHQLMVDCVAQQPAKRRRTRTLSPRRRRIYYVAGGATILVLATTGAAAATFLNQSSPVTNTNTARCYSRVSNDLSSHFPGTSIAQAASSPNGVGRVTDALDVCASLWREGLLTSQGSGWNPTPAAASTFPVPPLVACVLKDGTAAVFPGPPDTCQQLGLPAAEPPTVSPS